MLRTSRTLSAQTSGIEMSDFGREGWLAGWGWLEIGTSWEKRKASADAVLA